MSSCQCHLHPHEAPERDCLGMSDIIKQLSSSVTGDRDSSSRSREATEGKLGTTNMYKILQPFGTESIETAERGRSMLLAPQFLQHVLGT